MVPEGLTNTKIDNVSESNEKIVAGYVKLCLSYVLSILIEFTFFLKLLGLCSIKIKYQNVK